MTIKVYSSIMPGEPEEVYHDHGLTVAQWLSKATAGKFDPAAKHQPVTCAVNGILVKPERWAEMAIGPDDLVEFRVAPRGDVLDVVFPFWAGTVNVAINSAFNAFMPDVPGSPGRGGRQGSDLNPAEAKANTARLGQAVPEGFGRYIRYPDYLNQPRRYYLDRTTQVLNLLLAVGAGEYEIDPDLIKIGETPINELDNASVQIFEPGADLSGIEHHENWFNSPEVGSTSSSAGIRLKGITNSQRTYSGSATGSGDTFSGITVGELWSEGLRGSIDMTQTVTVTDGGSDAQTFEKFADIITGNFQHLLAGMTVNISSDILVDTGNEFDTDLNGTYVVSTINGTGTEITLETTGGDPVVDLEPGSGQITIDKDGTEYYLSEVVNGSEIRVDRVLSGGDPDPDWADELPATSLTISISWLAITFSTGLVGPFTACPDGEVTDTVEFDIFAPQGFGTVDEENIIGRSRTVRALWREVGASEWNVQDQEVSGSTRDQLGWTFKLNLPSAIRPEVQIGRVGGESVAITSLDRLELTALRCKLPTVTSYPGVTTMAVSIIGSDEISSQSNNQINLETLRKLPPVAGGSPTPTRSIARAACHVARTTGYDSDQLDVDEFERLDALGESRGDYFDYWFSDLTAKEALDTILRAGFAEATIDTGAIVPVRDEPRTKFEQPYSPQNMTGPLQRKFTGPKPDEPDGVEVEFTKAGTWTSETVKCFLPGDQGIKLDKIKLDGVTDRTRAWRIGMRRRRAQRYRRWEYSFSTELDALNSSYLSYVPLLDDVPGFGAVSIMEAIELDDTHGALITVSEPLEWVEGETHVVAYRNPEGETVGPFTAYQGDADNEILADIPEPWPEINLNQEPPHVYFGTSKRWSYPALITEIRPSGPRSVSVAATNYDDRVYEDDNATPPA